MSIKKQEIEALAKERLDELLGESHPLNTLRTSLCLYRAAAMTHALSQFGYLACMNAGTVSWKANNRPHPLPTHVGHEWQNPPEGECHKRYLSQGVLPEIHCWAAVPRMNLIVDPATAFVADLAEVMGIPWTEPKPPECLWATPDSLPDGWVYLADENACKLIYGLAGRMAHPELAMWGIREQ